MDRAAIKYVTATAVAFMMAMCVSVTLGMTEHAYAADSLSAGKSATSVTTQSSKAYDGLLTKNGLIYPCNSKGKRIKGVKAFGDGKYRPISQRLFVAANVKKIANPRYNYYHGNGYSRKGYSRYTYKYPLSTCKRITFLTKKGKNACTSLPKGQNIREAKIVNFNKTQLKTIPARMFENARFTSIALPKTLKEIGSAAFAGSSIKSITIPASCTTIGKEAFKQCRQLKKVSFNKKLTALGEGAFYDCRQLTDVDLSETKLKKVVGWFGDDSYNSTHCYVQHVELPSSCKEIAEKAFYYCSSLESVSFGGVEVIGAYAFYNCTKLGSVTLSAGATTIGDEAFYNCESLTSVDLPASIATIGSAIMGTSSKLSKLVLRTPEVTTISNLPYYWGQNVMVYVPESLISAYEDSGFWYSQRMHYSFASIESMG